MTRADAVALGLGHLYPEPRTDTEMLRELLASTDLGAAAERSRRVREDLDLATDDRRAGPEAGLNKTERSFATMLQTEGIPHLTQAIKLRLAGRTWYTPDFLVFPLRSTLVLATFVEIKGYLRDDAAVKIKVAAEMYPQFRWLLVRRWQRNGWDAREVGRGGIGTEPLHIPWIAGS